MSRRPACRAIGFVWSIALACPPAWTGVATAQDAEALSGRFRQASRAALPAVVTVRPVGVPAPGVGGIDPLTVAARAGGSGVVVDAARGLVVTNDHVIAGASQGVVVVMADGRERAIGQAWRDPKSDLAVLSVDPNGLVAAPWGDDRRLDIGDWVLAIGGPFGLSGTVTAGIVSGKGRGIGMALYEDLIQTDAAINPGNSGGPLINLQGEVVGINTALKSNGGGYEGVGFAVPATRARRVVAELAEFGRVRRAYLGITVRPLDPATAARLNLGIGEGSVIASVIVGGPATTAGLQAGDVILRINGQPAGPAGTIQAAIEVARVGEPIELTVDRNGQVFPVQVRPEPQPERYGLSGPASALVPGPIPAPGPVAVGALVPARRPGLRINVPGLDMVVPGPNLDVTPSGVRRVPRVLVPPPTGEVIVPGPVVAPADPVAAPGPATPTVPADPGPDPILTPIPGDPIPPPATRTPPPPAAPVETADRPGHFAALGLDLADATPDLVTRYRLPRDSAGPVITGVAPDGPADRGGLEPGMVLTDVAGRLVGNVDDFRRAAADRPAGRALLVRIRRGSKSESRIIVAPSAEASPSPAPAPAEPTLDPLPSGGPRPL